MQLDEIDVCLLQELEADADRTNAELARVVGLSPPATLNRVRRLKESGLIKRICARLDADAAGFPLQVYVHVYLGRHDDASHARLEKAVGEMENVVHADWVTGETDAVLNVVARSIAELQRVLLLLSSRGGAQRVVTLLKLQELKPVSALPLRAPTRAE
jgi:Lrp/AsnC family leucine-responsive transcriptional regulator